MSVNIALSFDVSDFEWLSGWPKYNFGNEENCSRLNIFELYVTRKTISGSYFLFVLSQFDVAISVADQY